MARGWVITGGRLALSGDGSSCFPTADEIYRSVIESEAVWPDVPPGPSGVAASIRFSRFPALPRAVLAATELGPTLTAEASISETESPPLTADDLQAGYLIHQGTWYPFEPSILETVKGFVAEEAGSGGVIRSYRKILTLKKLAASGEPVTDRLPIGKDVALSLAPRDAGAPAGVHATLYGYQHDGWRWLRFVLAEGVGGLLGDEMGLGKTLQVISAISDSGNGTLAPTLVVAPGSLLENWCREIGKFAPALSVLKHHGPMRTGRPAGLQGFDVVVTSYETVHRDSGLLAMQEWALVVLDEAQNIKNPEAIRTKSAKALRRRAGLAVTGTPMENRLLDIWSIIDFVQPGYLGGQSAFERDFANSPDGASRLEPLISPLLLRRRVRDVAKDLPERIDIPQVLELDTDEADEYEAIRQEIFAEHGKAAPLVALTKLRMFCAHPALLKHSQGANFGAFSKTRRTLEIIEEVFAEGEKLLIFTSFTEMADILVSQVQSNFGAYARTLDGRLAIDRRQPLLDEFAAQHGAALLVLNPRAGGSGLNITAANHVIHYNLEWNPALEDQASARAYRRGQTRPVTVHRLFFADTVEDVVNQRLLRKRDLSEAAVVGVSGEQEDLQDIMEALARSPVGRGKSNRS